MHQAKLWFINLGSVWHVINKRHGVNSAYPCQTGNFDDAKIMGLLSGRHILFMDKWQMFIGTMRWRCLKLYQKMYSAGDGKFTLTNTYNFTIREQHYGTKVLVTQHILCLMPLGQQHHLWRLKDK